MLRQTKFSSPEQEAQLKSNLEPVMTDTAVLKAYPDSSRPLLLLLCGGELVDRVGVPCDEVQHLQPLCLHAPTHTAALLYHVCHILQHLFWHTRTCSINNKRKTSVHQFSCVTGDEIRGSN